MTHIVRVADSLGYGLGGRSVAAMDFYSSLGRRPLLVFAHGYNTTEAEAVTRAGLFRRLFATGTAPDVVILRWPSEGRVAGYLEDRRHSKSSGPAIGRFILDLAARHFSAPIHVLAHSMGGRAVKHGIRAALAVRPDLAGLFTNLFWCAADIPSLDLSLGGAARGAHQLSGKVWSLYADDDRALKASKFVSAFRGRVTRRAGRSVPKHAAWDPRVRAVDVGAVNNIYDANMGHTYFCNSPDGQPGLVHHLIRQAMSGDPGAAWPGGCVTGLSVRYL